MLVASKARNFPSKFGHARPLGSGVIRFVCDRRTKATLTAPFPTGGGMISGSDDDNYDIIIQYQSVWTCFFLLSGF